MKNDFIDRTFILVGVSLDLKYISSINPIKLTFKDGEVIIKFTYLFKDKEFTYTSTLCDVKTKFISTKTGFFTKHEEVELKENSLYEVMDDYKEFSKEYGKFIEAWRAYTNQKDR